MKKLTFIPVEDAVTKKKMSYKLIDTLQIDSIQSGACIPSMLKVSGKSKYTSIVYSNPSTS
ncbi:MAG: hypothetical protein KGD73_05380 [Candidatus Lokiarchaeota archaeon]|nr:hypothetical protein [Candidatus Lokiarchaeota archaeon]